MLIRMCRLITMHIFCLHMINRKSKLLPMKVLYHLRSEVKKKCYDQTACMDRSISSFNVIIWLKENLNSSNAIILMGEREFVALLNLSSWCLVMVERLFIEVPWGCLRFVIVVFPDHTHLLLIKT